MPKSARKGGNDLVSEITNTFANVEPLSYVCAAVIVLYIAIAKPSNTPSFFGHPAFKAVLFIVVFLVTMMDPVIGILFGLAMVLSVSYSQSTNGQETFEGFENANNHGQGSGDCPSSHPCRDENTKQCIESIESKCPDGSFNEKEHVNAPPDTQADAQPVKSDSHADTGLSNSVETFKNYSEPAPMNTESFAPFPNM
jgi:MFS superfamily sulfate permease-like transporter